MRRQVPPPTRRLRFREYTPDDAGFVGELFADSQAGRFYPSMDTETAQRGWVEWNLSNYRKNGFGLWVIEHVEGGAALGDCGLTFQKAGGEERLEVGYHLKEAYRGQGYATEAARAVITYAFDELGVESVCSIVDPDNLSSVAVASRLHHSRASFVDSQGNRRLLFTTERVGPPATGSPPWTTR